MVDLTIGAEALLLKLTEKTNRKSSFCFSDRCEFTMEDESFAKELFQNELLKMGVAMMKGQFYSVSNDGHLKAKQLRAEPPEPKLYCVTPTGGEYEISYGGDDIGTIYEDGSFYNCVYGDNEPETADCLATATAFIINEHITDAKRSK